MRLGSMRFGGKSLALIAFLLSVSLFSYGVGHSPVLISDIALAGMVFWSVLTVRRVSTSPVVVIAGLWLVVALVGGVVSQVFTLYHNLAAFAMALVRAMFGVLCLMLGAPLLRRLGFLELGHALLIVLRIHALVLVGQVGTKVIMGGTGEVLRASGLFDEPAWFGWFTALSLFALASISRFQQCRYLRWWDYLLFLASAVLSTSVVAIALIPAALLTAYWTSATFIQNRMSRLCALIKLAVAMIIMLSVASGFLSIAWKFEPLEYLHDRIPRVLEGRDASAMDRIFGTLEVFGRVMERVPLTGTGMGNEVVMAQLLRPELKYQGGTHIGFITAFISTGLVGGILYLAMIVPLIIQRPTRALGVGFALAQLAFGGYRLGVFWLFLAVGIALSSEVQVARWPRNTGSVKRA